MDTENLMQEILFFVHMRLEDVAEEPSRLVRAQELVAIDIKTVLEQHFGTDAITSEAPSSNEALNELLDPDVSLPIEIALVAHKEVTKEGKSYLEQFDALSKTDPWVINVLGMPEAEQPYWKAALVSTYAVITGPERKNMATWDLIARTYRMVTEIPLDKRNGEGQNNDSST